MTDRIDIVDVLATYEAASREAALHGDGSVAERVGYCAGCESYSGIVWFASRGWVCACCDGVVSGYEPPTADQRQAGRPNVEARDYLLTMFRKGMAGI